MTMNGIIRTLACFKKMKITTQFFCFLLINSLKKNITIIKNLDFQSPDLHLTYDFYATLDKFKSRSFCVKELINLEKKKENVNSPKE
ncbi:hypothetical protein BpHYR1_028282 [Brachionus plicatilis]|uniref:Uncharacterized protein n=1 Tax=Brachionus plicatilis TaxID=10195 RepID=A0A3M7R6E5_BRAPC|nr:hypothetical protein BpHYR1_028282 [Brachionus plicatilis]